MGIGYEDYKAYLHALVDALKHSYGEGELLGCVLFGSVARGEARPDSDLDLLVVHRGGLADPLGRFLEVMERLRGEEPYLRLAAAGLRPDPYPVFLTERELWERPLILLDPLDHGILLWESGILKARFEALRRRLRELGAEKVTLPDGRWYWDLKPDWRPGEVIEL